MRPHKIALFAAAIVAICAGIVFGILSRPGELPEIAGLLAGEHCLVRPLFVVRQAHHERWTYSELPCSSRCAIEFA
jgi:hypothetical protein